MERLLNLIELEEIQMEAKSNLMLRNPMALNIYPTKSIKNIVKISQLKGVIFVEGNDDTGFNHIHARHEFWTKAVQLKQDVDNSTVRDFPSKFRTDNVPFFDYITIADSIYSDSNKVDSKKTELFDVYVGDHLHKDGTKREYRLVMYKNTLVVHTLYPTKGINNIKQIKGFRFLKGNGEIMQDYATSIVETSIPYFDFSYKLKYVVVITRNPILKTAMLSIKIINDAGYAYGQTDPQALSYADFQSTIHEKIYWDYADMRKIESIIKLIDKDSL
jgi:hypothetical protein